MGAIELNKQEFLKKIADIEQNPGQWQYLGDKPAIIDFHATWCGPCKMLAPAMDELADEYTGKVNIYKVDIDREPELASAFGVRSVPSLIFIPMQGKPHMSTGAMPKAALEDLIAEILLVKQ